MEYTVKLNEQQVELLKSILAQIEPTPFITSKPKKLSVTEQTIQSMREYRANKAARKRNNNNNK